MVTDQAMAQKVTFKPRWWLVAAGFVIILAGAFLAQLVRTADGTVVRDIRFTDTRRSRSITYYKDSTRPPTMAMRRCSGSMACWGSG